jgi:hypothetical protein
MFDSYDLVLMESSSKHDIVIIFTRFGVWKLLRCGTNDRPCSGARWVVSVVRFGAGMRRDVILG